MFKLKKIIGSRTNVPEIIPIGIDGAHSYIAGAVYYYVNGFLDTTASSENDIRVMLLENIPENSEKYTTYGYIITDNMVFEVPVDGSSYFSFGDLLSPYASPNGEITGVSSEKGTFAKVISNETTSSSNPKALVMLI